MKIIWIITKKLSSHGIFSCCGKEQWSPFKHGLFYIYSKRNGFTNQLRKWVLKSHITLTLHSISHLSVSSLPPSTTLSHTAVSQSLVMSPGGVSTDNSVTLTLADAQGMLDGVTLNLNTQVKRICAHTLFGIMADLDVFVKTV